MKTLKEEKTVIAEIGESQPRYPRLVRIFGINMVSKPSFISEDIIATFTLQFASIYCFGIFLMD